MGKYAGLLLTAVLAFGAGLLVARPAQPVSQASQPDTGFAAVPGLKGGWDLTGPYEVVRDWPKPLAQMPGHDQWTFGAMEGVFAETADRAWNWSSSTVRGTWTRVFGD